MDKIRFLTVADIVALHEIAMEMSEQPRASLVREDALESATYQAKNAAWYMGANAAEIAVFLATHIALAHPWVDGNKRTATMAGIQFALYNGAADPAPEAMISFGDLLLKYIEAGHDDRQNIFAEYVQFVSGWFGES